MYTANDPLSRLRAKTIAGLTNGAFKPQEVRVLEDRVLDAAGLLDIPVLTGIGEGPPVVLSPRQKKVVDRLVTGLGSDELGARARDSYRGAVKRGDVRVR